MKSFFSKNPSASHSGSPFGHGVSLASAGMMPSRFWLAKMVSRTLFQPSSKRCISLIFLSHSGVGGWGAGHVIDEPRLAGSDLLELLDVLDGLIRHRRLQIPAGIALEGVDGRRVAEQVRLPLAGVATDEAIEVIESHAVRPLIERPGLARLER